MRRTLNFLVALSVAPALASIYLWTEGREAVVLSLLVLALFVAWVSHLVIRARRAYLPMRRHWDVECVACGYDLTGNVSGVCPECGTPVDTRGKVG